jgi:hypothetical protein
MTENTKKRYFFVSPWPFVVAAILFALVTPRYLGLYGYGHWSFMQTGFKIEVESEVLKNEVLPKLSDENIKKTVERISSGMAYDADRLKEAGAAVMSPTYHITALFSMLFTAFAFFSKPRWPGFFSLPFSLYSMQFLNIMM